MGIESICVLGGSGFVGSHLTARLANRYSRVVVLTRRRERHRSFLVLPSVELVEADIHAPATLSKHFKGIDAVINLVGILNEGGGSGQTFRSAHIDLNRAVIEACQSNQVSRLLHMSALNAGAASASSEYLRSKGEAENYLFDIASKTIQVSCFRPSVIFGPGDSFFNRFAALLKNLPVFPLACPQSRFAPVYVGDVVDSICADLASINPETKRHDLCGPSVYTLRQLVEYTASVIGLKRSIINLPDPIARLQASIMGRMPGKPFSRDNYLSLQTDSICSADCKPQATSVESVVPDYLGCAPKQDHLQSLRRQARRN